jgi:septum formation protein
MSKSAPEFFLMQQLVLASSSVFRQALLQRLALPFEVASPDIDEAPLPGEQPGQTAARLALAKARAVAARFPGALLIGSDQVAECAGVAIGKPGNHIRAVTQLRAMRGQRVTFYTGLCLLNAKSGSHQSALATNIATFRDYSDNEIERYLRREQPYHCAGSAKIEGLGITLIARLEGDDPNALIGLPLIELVSMLKREGIAVP